MDATIAAEQSTIGIVLRQPELLATVQVNSSWFSRQEYQQYWQAIESLAAEGEPVDIVSVADRLESDGQGNCLQDLVELLENTLGSAENLRHYVQIIESRSLNDTLWRQLSAAMKDRDVADVVRIAEDVVARRMPGAVQSVSGDLVQSWQEWVDDQAQLREAPPSTWGLTKLNDQLGRMVPGRLYVLAARPGSGKTALALNLAISNAQNGGRIGFISLEQTKAELAARAVCYLSGASLAEVSGEQSVSQVRRREILDGKAELQNLAIQIYDGSPMDISRVTSAARTLVERHHAQILMLDYVQTIKTAGKRDRHIEVGDSIQALKAVAKRLHVPVIAVAQCRRDAEHRLPTMSDIKDSGTIEQEADVILALHREYDEEGRPKPTCTILCLKNRHGPAPWRTDVLLQAWCFRFADLAA